MLKSDLQRPWKLIQRNGVHCTIISATCATIARRVDEDAAKVIVDSVNTFHELAAILDARPE